MFMVPVSLSHENRHILCHFFNQQASRPPTKAAAAQAASLSPDGICQKNCPPALPFSKGSILLHVVHVLAWYQDLSATLRRLFFTVGTVLALAVVHNLSATSKRLFLRNLCASPFTDHLNFLQMFLLNLPLEISYRCHSDNRVSNKKRCRGLQLSV